MAANPEKEMRQAEVDAYDNNIARYTAIVAGLDGNWDDDLIQFKGVGHHDAARDCPEDRIERLAELQLHLHMSGLIKTEKVERFKANALLNSL